jgi:hypothetical protein
MTETKSEPQSDAPYGTVPRRPAWPLILLIVLFALWFLVLLWLAIRYPAR